MAGLFCFINYYSWLVCGFLCNFAAEFFQKGYWEVLNMIEIQPVLASKSAVSEGEPVSPNSVLWYPMRVTYNRELAIKKRLDELAIVNFVPMRYDMVDHGGERRKELVPAIHNLVFIRSSKGQLTELKRFTEEFEPMRFMVRYSLETNRTPEIITVPDKQMDNFMRVASVNHDDVVFLKYEDFLNKEGKRVKVVDGNFAGVEGVIKRIKRDRVVVVLLQDVAAVAITHLPPSYLQMME